MKDPLTPLDTLLERAIDASVLELASRPLSKMSLREYFAVLDDAAFGGATPVLRQRSALALWHFNAANVLAIASVKARK